MAGPRKSTNIDDEIRNQEEAVTKAKQKYDTEVAKRKDLYAKSCFIKSLYSCII